MNQNFFIELFQRWGSENPVFFKKIKFFGLIGCGLLTAFLWFCHNGTIHISDAWYNSLQMIATFLGGMFVTAQSATTKPELMDEKTINNVKNFK